MGNGRRNQRVVARRQAVGEAIAQKIELAVEDKNTFLERMRRDLGSAARRQRRNAKSRMHRSDLAVDERRVGEACRMARVDRMGDQIRVRERADLMSDFGDDRYPFYSTGSAAFDVKQADRWRATM